MAAGSVETAPRRSGVTIQRDLSRLEKKANRNLMKFNKGKWKVPRLGRNSPIHQYMQGSTQLEDTLAGKDMVVLMDIKPQQSALMGNKATSLLGCI